MKRITDTYGEKFEGITPFRKGLGIMSGFGCAAVHQCGFCARTDRALRFREPGQFWQEISNAMKDYGVEYFFDFADSILDNPNHLEKLLDSKPRNIEPRFRVFARADQVTNSHNLNLLQKLGVYEVFVGFESGSREMLKAMFKDTTPEQNLEAARALGERDIFIAGCFVLGAPGESRKTLEESVKHAAEIQKASKDHLLVCGASPVNILPGSPWFARIKDEKGILGNDDLDRDELRKIWYARYCPETNFEMVEEYAERLRKASGAIMQYEKGTNKK
jgi:anaerobic magnesium-protoporphyrin IX monomethyl ester cyclase